MKEQTIILPKGIRNLTRFVAFASALPSDIDIKVTFAEKKARRSDAQNAYLWGVVYEAILEHLPGWDKDDVHEYCLGEWSGWEMIEGFGRRRMRPIRRSSKLTTIEFMTFIDFIQRTMAEKGIYIPDANEQLERVA